MHTNIQKLQIRFLLVEPDSIRFNFTLSLLCASHVHCLYSLWSALQSSHFRNSISVRTPIRRFCGFEWTVNEQCVYVCVSHLLFIRCITRVGNEMHLSDVTRCARGVFNIAPRYVRSQDGCLCVWPLHSRGPQTCSACDGSRNQNA